MTGGELATIIVAALAFLGVWYTGRVQLRRTVAENAAERQHTANSASQAITDAALSLVKPLEDRITRLEAELVVQRDRRVELEARVRTLEAFIRLNTEFNPEEIR